MIPKSTVLQSLSSMFSADLPTFEPLVEDAEPKTARADKPIPNRKRRFHGNAMRRADRRFRGTQKMLALLAPAGVQSGSDAMWRAQQTFGL